MNLSTALGLIVAVGALVASVKSEGGELGAFVNVPAMLVVFGGTLGAALVSFPGSTVISLPRLIGQAFYQKMRSPLDLGQVLVRLAERARREGLLALEEELSEIENALLRRGVMLVIDGTDPELVRSILQSDIAIRRQERESQIGVLEAMGGYAPTMGIIGTVMGLVHVLSKLTDPTQLGGAIAVAFIATFYGVSSANLLWLPLGAKLKKQMEAGELLDEMILEGLASIQSGENPRILQERLEPFLAGHRRGKASKEQEGNVYGAGIKEDFQPGQA